MASVMEQSERAVQDLSIEMTRVFRAPRSKVWNALTQPEEMKMWWGPKGMTTTEVESDLRPGGAYRVTMGADGMPERVGVAFGTYAVIVPEERLEYTFNGTWPGCEETYVTITLRNVAEGTELRLRNDRFSAASVMGGHQTGWTDSFEKLGALLAS